MTTVLLDKIEGIAWIRLNRSHAMNSFNPELVSELDVAFKDASTDRRVKAVVIMGDEKAFSTGADLKTVIALFDAWPAYVEFLNKLNETLLSIEESPIPTIAKVRGYALAGGLELILCCDLAIAAEDARIGDQHSNFGLMPGGGGIPRLIRRIGLQPALELLFTGRWLTGIEAAQRGIVLRAVPSERLDQEIEVLTMSLAKKSRRGLGYVRRAALAGLGLPIRSALSEERLALLEYFSTSPDPRAGLEAFISKTEPTFSE